MADINKKSQKELDSKYESLPEAACSFCHYSEEPDEEGFSEVFGDYMVDDDLFSFPNQEPIDDLRNYFLEKYKPTLPLPNLSFFILANGNHNLYFKKGGTK